MGYIFTTGSYATSGAAWDADCDSEHHNLPLSPLCYRSETNCTEPIPSAAHVTQHTGTARLASVFGGGRRSKSQDSTNSPPPPTLR